MRPPTKLERVITRLLLASPPLVRRLFVRSVVPPILWFVDRTGPYLRAYDPQRVDDILHRTAAVRARLDEGGKR